MKKALIIISVAVVLVILSFVIFISLPSTKYLEANFYDSNMNKVGSKQFAIVEGVPNVKYVNFDINLKNNDVTPMNFRVSQLTPTEIFGSMPNTSIYIGLFQSGKISTLAFDINPFINKNQTFCVTTSFEPTLPFRRIQTKTDCITLSVLPDENPTDGSTVTEQPPINPPILPDTNLSCTESWSCSAWTTCSNSLQSRTCTDSNTCGTTTTRPESSQICSSSNITLLTECLELWSCSDWSICSNTQQSRSCIDTNNCGTTIIRPSFTQSCSSPTSCTESWSCSAWTTCSNSLQSRTCTDSNTCGTTTTRPLQTQSCSSPTFETNAIIGSYNNYRSGTYIRIDADGSGTLEQYNYASTLSSGSCGGTFLTSTPEGYAVNKYRGSSGWVAYICNPSGAGYKRYA